MGRRRRIERQNSFLPGQNTTPTDLNPEDSQHNELQEPSDVSTEDLSESTPENDPAGSVKSADAPSVQSLPTRITSEAQAIALLRAKYKVTAGCKTVVVTEDGNVFWQNQASSGINHAQTHNLKLFRIQWQD